MEDCALTTDYLKKKSREIIVYALLILTILFLYWQVRGFDFVSFDDSMYVAENRNVRSGLNLTSIKWAFSATSAGNWHPLTWLSHMLDVSIFGMDPGMHHFTNVIFHILNTILFFIFFCKTTGALWRSAFVSALFALHPLHVESVAWISERKDVLSTFFWTLTMLSYAWYARRPEVKRYLLVILFFVLGLMSKPMLVTLPFVLLLLDFWPLYRFDFRTGHLHEGSHNKNPEGFYFKNSNLLFLIWEKAPLFVIAGISSIITFYVQDRGGAVSTLDVLPFFLRVENALVSYVSYMVKMIWPFNLAVFYPYPVYIPIWKIAGAVFCLAVLSCLALWFGRKYRYLISGWLWYVGTLVPVIGIVQVGSQAMSDRYTYIPLVGLFIMISWGVPDLLRKLQHRRIALAFMSIMVFSLCSVVSWKQVRCWKGNISLFTHAMEVTDDNYLAHNSLGAALYKQGDVDAAIHHYHKAIRIKPDYKRARNNLGIAIFENGKIDEAIPHYKELLRLHPDYAAAHYNMGLALYAQGKADEAIDHYKTAIRLDTENAQALNNLGFILAEKGRYNEALESYKKALRINPEFVKAYMNLAALYTKQGRIGEAIFSVQESLKIEPENPALHCQAGNLYARKGNLSDAILHYEAALSRQQNYINALHGLAVVYSKKADYERARGYLKRILEIRPEDPGVHYNIACMYSLQNNVEEAIAWLKIAVKKGFKNWDQLKNDRDLENARGTSFYGELIEGR